MNPSVEVFLLIGQSNMAGRGCLDEVPVLDCPDVLMYRDGRWLPAEEPLHTDKPELAGVGLGMRFAVEVVERGGIAPVGLLPCAVGGTPLRRWMPGADLYENAVRIAHSALQGGRLRGILWHQGEADAKTRDDASSYGRRFVEMVQALRTELAAEDVPLLAGELGSFLREHPGCDYFETVNRHLRELEGVLGNYAFVSAEGLGDNGDTLHFHSAALREFGRRYAERFLAYSSER